MNISTIILSEKKLEVGLEQNLLCIGFLCIYMGISMTFAIQCVYAMYMDAEENIKA